MRHSRLKESKWRMFHQYVRGEVSDEQVFIIQSYKILMTPNLQDYNNKNIGMSFPSR